MELIIARLVCNLQWATMTHPTPSCNDVLLAVVDVRIACMGNGHEAAD